jgi:trehalose 2-sulfotransferase
MNPRVKYIICSAPRSGSHLLSTTLTNTGLAGFPQEHFNPWHMQNMVGFPDEFIYTDDYVNDLMRKYTTPNGVFGTKASFDQIVNFLGSKRLVTLLGEDLKYIFIKRKNKTAQAVSLAKASQTLQFMSDQEKSREAVYNYYHIWQCSREINISEKGWTVFFAEHAIQPYIVYYEELVEKHEETIMNVLNFLGIKADKDFKVPAPSIQKQADHINKEWITQFENDEEHTI